MRNHVLACWTVIVGFGCCSVFGEEVLFQGTVPRVNEVSGKNLSIKINKDKDSSSGWGIVAESSGRTIRQDVNVGNRNILVFPDFVLEMTNANVPTLDRWWCMAETIGDYKIVKKDLAEFKLPAILKTNRRQLNGKDLVILSNGIVALSVCPAVNGAIVKYVDLVTGINWFYLNSETFSGADAGTFAGVGFVELVNQYAGVVGNEFKVVAIDEKNDAVALKMSAIYKRDPRLKVERTLRLEKGSTAFSVKSILSAVGGDNKKYRLKHRPELVIGAGISKGDCFYVLEKDVMREVVYAGGQLYVRSNRLAAFDRNAGEMLAVVYQKKDLETLYLWMDNQKCNIEAWTIEKPLTKPLALEVTYYLVRGMSGLSALNEKAALHVETDKQWSLNNEDAVIHVAVGTPRSYKDLKIHLIVIGPDGGETKLKPVEVVGSVPGMAVHRRLVWNTGDCVKGNYRVNIMVFSNGEQLINHTLTLKVLGEGISKYKALGREIGRLLNEFRSSYKGQGDAALKKRIYDQFAATARLRYEYVWSLKSGDIEKLDMLNQRIKRIINHEKK